MHKTRRLIILFLIFATVASILAMAAGPRFDGSDEILTPDYYDSHVRAAFKRGEWEEGKRLLDAGLKAYPDVSALNELAGQYYYNFRQYDDSRFYLVKSVKGDNANVRAKQLLVNVEEETENYSSAICYVNELLEVNPYWKGLWRRKIRLYRKQGNEVEADRLLKRICQIYPDDEQLKNDYAGRLEETYIAQKGDRTASIATLKELVTVYTNRPDLFLTLSNLLLQEGRAEEAKEVAARGVELNPYSVELIIKRAGILADEYRYLEAMAYVKSCMQRNKSGALARFYNSLQNEAARAESQRDPYVLYGKIYDSQKSQESLDYMLNTSFSRGYDEDALFYISEARKREGDTPALLYKAYVVNKRIGNDKTAFALLNKLYDRNPADADIADELAANYTDRATNYMADGNYAEALPLLQRASQCARSTEVSAPIWSKIVVCNEALRRYSVAEEALDTLRSLNKEMSGYTAQKASLLAKRGKVAEALDLLEKELQDTVEHDEIDRIELVNSYEEIAVPYIKTLQENGAVRKVYTESCRLLNILPSSVDGLHYAVNAASALRDDKEFARLTTMGRMLHPDDLFFVVKQAQVYQNRGNYEAAVSLVNPNLSDYSGDQQLIAAHSEGCAAWAQSLIKRHQGDSALIIVDKGLEYDPLNKDLLYTKGLAFERMRQYDSAYVYLSRYQPSPMELDEHKRLLDNLQYKQQKNSLTFEYLQARYGEEDVITSVATVAYSRKMKHNNTLTARVNYVGRDGADAGSTADDQVPGGQSVQLQAEFEHVFNDKWRGMANFAWAGKYFPQIVATVGVTRTFKNDWEVGAHVNYRRVSSYRKTFAYDTSVFNEDTQQFGTWTFADWQTERHNLFNIGVQVDKPVPFFDLTAKFDTYLMSGHFYVNGQVQAKYFPWEDRRMSLYALAGVGTAPEATFIDNAMPGSFDKLNSLVGFGASYRFTRHVTVGVLGTWNTFYHDSNRREGTLYDYRDYNDTRYKNLFNVDAQVVISF